MNVLVIAIIVFAVALLVTTALSAIMRQAQDWIESVFLALGFAVSVILKSAIGVSGLWEYVVIAATVSVFYAIGDVVSHNRAPHA